jgi:hypothetical protein
MNSSRSLPLLLLFRVEMKMSDGIGDFTACWWLHSWWLATIVAGGGLVEGSRYDDE